MISYSRLAAVGALLPALLLAKPEAGESAHYRAVRERVGEGGQVFVYVDVDGYFAELGHELTTSVAAAAGDEPALAAWKQDYAALATELGLTQIKAAGLSARRIGDHLYANRMYLHVPEGRRGLLRVLGGAAHPFASAKLAPADTDLFVETEVDVSAFVTSVSQLLQRVSPELAALLPLELPTEGELAGAAALFSFTKFQGRCTVAVRLHDGPPLGADLSFPHDVFAGIDAHGPQLLALLQTGELKPAVLKTEGARTFYVIGAEAPGLAGPLVAVAEGERLYCATSETFLRECLDRKGGLAEAAPFKQALAATAAEGNSIVYASPRLFRTLHALMQELPKLPTADRSLEVAFRSVLKRLTVVQSPVVSVSSNLPEGVLVRSVGPDSLRESLPLLGLATPDLAGNILRVALPAHVAGLQEQALAGRHAESVRGNLAKISAAAATYFAANPEAAEVAFPQLLEHEAALAQIAAVAGEDYSAVTVRRDRDAVELQLESGYNVSYGRPLTADERARIERNLALFDEAAAFYFSSNPDETSMSSYAATSAGGSLTEAPTSVVGEEYSFEVSREADTIEVTTPGGTTVAYQRVPGVRWTALKRRAQQTAAIRANLALVYSVATDYLANHPDESYVSGYEIFGEDKERPALRPIANENYDSVRVTRTSAVTTISVPGLGDIAYEAPLDPKQEAAIRANLLQLAQAAAAYFARHPQENLMVVGELAAAEGASFTPPAPVAGEDYMPLVIERDAPSLTLPLPAGRKLTAALR